MNVPESLTMVGNTKLDRAEKFLARAEKRLAQMEKKFLEEKDPENKKMFREAVDDARKAVAGAHAVVNTLLIASNGNGNGTVMRTMSLVGLFPRSPRCGCCLSSSSCFFFVSELQFLFRLF